MQSYADSKLVVKYRVTDASVDDGWFVGW